jgi:hypothetical protein
VLIVRILYFYDGSYINPFLFLLPCDEGTFTPMVESVGGRMEEVSSIVADQEETKAITANVESDSHLLVDGFASQMLAEPSSVIGVKKRSSNSVVEVKGIKRVCRPPKLGPARHGDVIKCCCGCETVYDGSGLVACVNCKSVYVSRGCGYSLLCYTCK